MDGFKPFLRRVRRRQITSEDVKRLLDIKIRRISRFDINKNRDELQAIEMKEAETKDALAHLTAHVIAYLKGLIKEYGKKYPRCTKVAEAPFEKVDMRAITAEDLTIRYDRENHFIGCAIKGGDELFKCSGLDRIVCIWKDGRYRMLAPPDKFFVDVDFERVMPYDREKEFTMVYEEPLYGHTYIKRFKMGGMILNKDYRLAPPKSKILLFTDGCPEKVYMKFRRVKNQRVHQAFFDPREVTVRGASARGIQMTTKSISRISSSHPAWWDDVESGKVAMF